MKINRYILFLLALLLFSTGAGLAADTLGKAHVDKTLGFSIKFPKEWSFVVSHESEKYIVGTFIAKDWLDKKVIKDRKEFASHRPEMRIIAFTPENVETGRETEKEQELFGRKIVVTTQSNPYKDFKEYIKRTINGFYFGDEEEDKIGGVPCTMLDVVWEQNRPPLRRVCCIYHLEDVDIAVYFDIMEEYYGDYISLFRRAFKSFKTVERELVDAAEGADAGVPLTRKAWVESKSTGLPEGWWAKESKSHLIISHTGKKYTDKVAKFCDAIRKQITKEFARKGAAKKEESIRLPIVRVCGSVGEFNAFIDTVSADNGFNAKTGEVVVYDGTKEGFQIEWVYSRLGGAILFQFLNDEFKLIQPDPWYSSGLSYYYRCFKGKGSSVKYVHDTAIADRMRQAEKSGNCKTLKRLLDPKGRGIQSNEDYWKVGNMVCFLRSKEGKRKPWKGTLERYLSNFRIQFEMMSKDTETKINDLEETTEAEEAKKKTKRLTNRITDLAKDVRMKTYEETFGEWDDRDWEKFEKAYLDWMM